MGEADEQLSAISLVDRGSSQFATITRQRRKTKHAQTTEQMAFPLHSARVTPLKWDKIVASASEKMRERITAVYSLTFDPKDDKDRPIVFSRVAPTSLECIREVVRHKTADLVSISRGACLFSPKPFSFVLVCRYQEGTTCVFLSCVRFFPPTGPSPRG